MPESSKRSRIAVSFGPASVHQLRSKSRIARSRSVSAIGSRLAAGRAPIKDPRPAERYRGRATHAGLAQLVEHFSCKEDVVGSIPAPGSGAHGFVQGMRRTFVLLAVGMALPVFVREATMTGRRATPTGAPPSSQTTPRR